MQNVLYSSRTGRNNLVEFIGTVIESLDLVGNSELKSELKSN